MPKVRLAHYILGLHGLAVLRNWLHGEREAARHVRALREFAASMNQNPGNVEFELRDDAIAEGMQPGLRPTIGRSIL
jgi:hypothetical protein